MVMVMVMVMVVILPELGHLLTVLAEYQTDTVMPLAPNPISIAKQ